MLQIAVAIKQKKYLQQGGGVIVTKVSFNKRAVIIYLGEGCSVFFGGRFIIFKFHFGGWT